MQYTIIHITPYILGTFSSFIRTTTAVPVQCCVRSMCAFSWLLSVCAALVHLYCVVVVVVVVAVVVDVKLTIFKCTEWIQLIFFHIRFPSLPLSSHENAIIENYQKRNHSNWSRSAEWQNGKNKKNRKRWKKKTRQQRQSTHFRLRVYATTKFDTFESKMRRREKKRTENELIHLTDKIIQAARKFISFFALTAWWLHLCEHRINWFFIAFDDANGELNCHLKNSKCSIKCIVFEYRINFACGCLDLCLSIGVNMDFVLIYFVIFSRRCWTGCATIATTTNFSLLICCCFFSLLRW